ncbi:MAG: hypothetical protein EHM64_07145 [Ignavibacteriae bacterium]|nr:MAG: hypothetical protein EHM64_07145 [Ignavibacteriota bacterium]
MWNRIRIQLWFLVLVTGSMMAQPRLVLGTNSVDVGRVPLSTTKSIPFLIKNTGTSVLIINSMSSSNFAFTIQRASNILISPGDSLADTLNFRPRKAFDDTASFVITCNDPGFTTPMTATAYGEVIIDPNIIPYRNDVRGDAQYRREGIMDGNQISTLFYNEGEVARYKFQPSVVWPKGTNHSYLDGVAVLIGAKTTAPGNGKPITPIESAYREEVDADPLTGEEWVMQPLPGYFNPSSTRPAINRDTSTFPSSWPLALGLSPDWNGYWYGYFGRGVTNADFETFFVMDDSKDKEFTRAPYSYFPVAADSLRGGLGLRVEVRGFQWSHVLAEDIIFWHYDIVNISDWTYDSTCFGFYTDPGVGGIDVPGNSARFNSTLDLAYAWNTTGKGIPDNWKTGYVGYAYLESPGNPYDGIDNDEDGMVDERRDDNIDNDHDWVPFGDLNHNGKWDPGEPLNDDLGRDGVGPTDLQYTGPDAGEGDGLPTHGEPNFDETDKDESDQIGLSSAAIWGLADKTTSGGWPKNDDVMWRKMNSGFADTAIANTNISMTFSSGPFTLKQGKRERFSMALAMGEDLDDLIFNKETVQEIYNANYNFSKPPYTPHMTAVPGNGRVFLYWDDIAERSIDRFMGLQDTADASKGYKKDFEGYLVYRSTEAEFNDIKIITDSKGSTKYYKPLAQFDLIDSISGPDPVGINGAHFWRGNNTGLQHSFIDSTALNGVRYYYAVVSYDMGDPKRGTNGLQPTECAKIITEDFAGTLKFVDINCAVVTPNAAAAGYKPPEMVGDLGHIVQGLGTGALEMIMLNPAEVKDGAEYNVKFKSDTTVPSYRTISCDVYRTFHGVTDTVLSGFTSVNFGKDKFTPPIDGMILAVLNDTLITINEAATGWLVGKSTVNMRAAFDNTFPSRFISWPGDYEIQFYSSPMDTTAINAPTAGYPKMPVNITITRTTDGSRSKFIVQDRDGSGTLTFGDTIRILESYLSPTSFKYAYKISYGQPWGTVVEPQAGDRFVIKTKRPFLTGDYFTFSMRPSSTDNTRAKEQLANITVVPNPYISAAKWERRSLYPTGRGDRKIEFKKLPAKCTVRIYTITGALVKTLYKDSSPMDGSLPWNLVSEDGMDIAYGLYIYHVDAPGIGESIGKFAVVK